MKPIISELNIERYRGINHLKLDNLSRINVLAGVNNSGKTSILEVIGLLSSPLDRINFQRYVLMRVPKDDFLNRKMADYIANIFTHEQNTTDTFLPIQFQAVVGENPVACSYSASKGISINAAGVETKQIKVFTNYSDANKKTTASHLFKNNGRGVYLMKNTPLFKTDLIYVDSNFYKECVGHISNSMKNEQKNELLSVIQSFDPDVMDILLDNDEILLHSRQSGVLPLFTYGSGLQKVVLLAASLMEVKDNMILIDEIDGTINISAFKEVFSWFVKACRELNIQAFVTTHSIEAIDAILEATEDDAENGLEDDIRIITLRKTPKSHKSVALIRTGEEARSDRDRCEMELRV